MAERIFKNKQSEQITLSGDLVFEHDKRLVRSEIFSILNGLFGNSYSVEKINNKKVDVVTDGNKKHFLLISQITYLGNPHPTYKKRIQLKNWYKDIYDQYKNDKNTIIHLVGIYRYGLNVIFVEFEKEPYFNRKMHNSSAHVYTNDLFQAMKHKVFSKKDVRGNRITTITLDAYKEYLLASKTIESSSNADLEIINEVNKFNKTTPIFTNWITVRQAIEEMHNNSFPKWKEAEWAGFYLEYLYSSYIDKNHIQNIIEYLNNKSSLTRHLDFDLYFHNANFYGDLKSSSSSEKSTMLNDKSNILFELNSYGKLWYLIYEHDTVKDRDLDGHPFTKSRLEYIRLFEPNYKLGEDLSYYQRLKAKVKYCKMFIVEINKINYSSLLEEMTSNFHQPDGTTLRQPKLKFTKENIKNAIVYSYFPTN